MPLSFTLNLCAVQVIDRNAKEFDSSVAQLLQAALTGAALREAMEAAPGGEGKCGREVCGEGGAGSLARCCCSRRSCSTTWQTALVSCPKGAFASTQATPCCKQSHHTCSLHSPDHLCSPYTFCLAEAPGPARRQRTTGSTADAPTESEDTVVNASSSLKRK